MAHSRFVTYPYTLFLALMLALFVGFGINAFYEAPVEPTLPVRLQFSEQAPSTETLTLQQRYNQQLDRYHNSLSAYNRNVSLIAAGAGILMVLASLFAVRKLAILGRGLLLGGLFTLIYAIIRAVISGESGYTFLVVTLGLAVVLYLGYYWFIRKPRPRRIPVRMA